MYVLCVCVSVCVCLCARALARVNIHICMYICIYVLHVYMYVCMYYVYQLRVISVESGDNCALLDGIGKEMDEFKGSTHGAQRLHRIFLICQHI